MRKTLAALLLPAMAAAVFAAPELKADKTVFNGGDAAEGSSVKAVFKLTNTGNEPLKISSVRPGCGCTVVKYDSVIAPGKTGVIEPVVNLKGFRPGFMSRGVTVTSNAANTPTLSLTIEANVMAAVEVSENYLTFEGAGKKTITLSSPKKDLKVSDVIFTPRDNSGVPGWAINAPHKVNYKFAPSDSARADGYKVYKLDIDSPGVGGKGAGTVIGVFEITTNHPERKGIVIGGEIR
ncbi:MAG: DUF1573 domain-containing protein [Chitinispirillales bacterium]|jgi:hypothetical protein|nr:DUF1573 domain-containing protein [Chitinispirillales bacterium]